MRRKINPHSHRKVEMLLRLKSLDGDQAICNNFVGRSRVTVGDMMEVLEVLPTIDNSILVWDFIEMSKQITQDVLNSVSEEQRIELFGALATLRGR